MVPIDPVAEEKAQLRRRIRTRRRERDAAARALVAKRLGARVEELPLPEPGATIACYASIGTEPGTDVIREKLRDRGYRVLLPVVCPDRIWLDWALDEGELTDGDAYPSLVEPTGPRLGFDAIACAGLMLTPAMAVDVTGSRLGKGGGFYDRALGFVQPQVPVVAVVHDDEVLRHLPTRDHDHPVDGALTPGGFIRLPTVSREPAQA